MDPHQVEGLNLTEYFYFDDHHPYDLTGHRCAERAALLLDGSGCVQHSMKQLAATTPTTSQGTGALNVLLCCWTAAVVSSMA